MDFIKEKINMGVKKLKEFSESKLCDIEFRILECDGYKTSNEFPGADAGWRDFQEGERLSGVDRHFWLHFKIAPVEACENKQLLFRLKTGREGWWDADNPQGTVFINGKIAQALDLNHTWIALDFGKEYDVYIYFWTGTFGGYFECIPTLMLRDVPTYDLYWDCAVPFDAMALLEEDSNDYILMKDALDKTFLRVDFRDVYSINYYNSIIDATAYIRSELYQKLCGGNGGMVNCIGHTHIDVAWLWTVAQTREKAERSFSTVLSLMKKYPEYKFMSSQPQLYQHVKEANPELYEQIKERVAEGRWEVEGAMWLEADCNLCSGESLVRQIIHGKKFMKDEFGVDSKILWLPDVFGYSAALPQILKKSGVDKFFTTKMSWNETNQMPHDTFMWQGIDGTEVFTSLIPVYVNVLNAAEVKRTWDTYKDKSLSKNTLLTFGYGDGGGGTTAEMMEAYRRLKDGLPGMPKAQIKTGGEFFDMAEEDFVKNTKELRTLPKWIGELYLELHRGTYTSIGKNKRNNRKSELLYQEAETLSVSDMVLCGGEYDNETFEKHQKTILLNQFHDIIPGSSIKEVYEVTDVEYAEILKDGRASAERSKQNIIANIGTDGGIFVYNPSPYEVSDLVVADGVTYYAENVPPHGYSVIKPAAADYGVTVGDKVIENDLIRVSFDDKYQIISVYDKEAEREVIAKGGIANRLEVYEDYPKDYDAWEISSYYKQKLWVADDVSDVEKTQRGYIITRHYGKSVIKQEINLRKGSKRIDFITDVDWHEDHVLLKAAFPLDVHSNHAAFDIQFGNVERPTVKNTSWDEAKFEVCAHKWADISECGYGVGLLNDCKYGYSTDENIISLSLLKCATYPCIDADRERHEFTYSLFPHIGDWREGGVVKEAYLLNMPLQAQRIGKNTGGLSQSFCLASCDSENIVLETVKKAEEDDSIIVRAYECFNKKTKAAFNFGFNVKKAYLCNLLEENIAELEVKDNKLLVPFGNYEIITLKLER